MSSTHDFSGFAGKCAVFMGTAGALLPVSMQLCNSSFGTQFAFGPNVSVPFFIATTTFFVAYMRTRTERILDTQEKLLAQPIQGLEKFENGEDLLNRLAEVTVGAESVTTLNLSPARGLDPRLDVYFSAVHKYLMMKKDIPLRTFRTLAALDSKEKALWLLDRCELLKGNGRISTSIMPNVLSSDFPFGFHVVKKDGQWYSFIYPPVNPSGVMQSFMIIGDEVAGIINAQFDGLWIRSPSIHDGKAVRNVGLDAMLRKYPDLKDNDLFVALSADAN